MSVSLLLGLTSLFVTADQPKGDALKQELEKLQGTWTVTGAEEEGKAMEALKPLIGTKITFKGTDFQMFGDEKQKEKFKVDPSKKPCHIDFIPDKDAPKEQPKLPGIYLLAGDTLKIGFPIGKGTRKIDPKTKEVIEEKSEPLVCPTALGAKETFVIILKREIKK